MSQSEQQLEQLQQQLAGLQQSLRQMRHGINNHVAVLMAMAELSQRNPAQAPKLCALCLEKAPAIAAAVGSFSEQFNGTISLQEELAGQTAAHSA